MHFAQPQSVDAMSAALAEELLGRRLESAWRSQCWTDRVIPGGSVVAAVDIPSDTCSDLFTGETIAANRGQRLMIQIKLGLRSDGLLKMEPDSSSLNAGTCWLRAIRIAEDCHSCNVRLLEVGSAGFVARTTRQIARGEELLLWFSPEVLARLGIPFLTPINIRGKQISKFLLVEEEIWKNVILFILIRYFFLFSKGEKAYVCHCCGVRMETPNPLKLHLSMDCGRIPLDSLWERLKEPLTSPGPPPPLTASPPLPHPTQHHQSSRGHLCIYCGKLYSRKYGLKIHIRTHTGYKPLKCKFCLRPFGDPSNLNKHIRLHAEGGDAPYRCVQCGKVLVRRRDLERHMKSRHQQQEDASSSDSDLGFKHLK
ncbi:hypothetical protein J437_LFUL012849 [Ladona fulva]|uniref:PR domain zinc finger protein 13 n=1 Tax=Ladona fulva TaxID=123851 RepID=A0A8K0KDP1_LADFU|nr:hypothetical protein J437_LFUL012849 [Ladona fulva]